MLPVQDDLGDVVCRVKQVVVSPFIPVDGHCPILVHAVSVEKKKKKRIGMIETNIHILLLLTSQLQTLQNLHRLPDNLP